MQYPMMRLDGLVVPKRNRQSPTSDVDLTPRQFRRYINASGLQDVLLKNGVGQITMKRITYHGSGYLFAAAPIIPGQQRGDVGGFHKRGPAPGNVQQLWEDGPGAQPRNPGGPGKIAAPTYRNPMTG